MMAIVRRKNVRSLITVALGAVGAFTTALPALAGSAPPPPASVQTGGKDTEISTAPAPAQSSFVDKLSLLYLNEWIGPGVSSPTDYRLPDNDLGYKGGSQPNIYMKNYLASGYQLGETSSIGPVAYWTWQPYGERDTKLKDFYIKALNSKIYNGNGLNIYGDLRMGFPTSSGSRDNTLQMYLMSKQMADYAFPNSRFTLGVITIEAMNFYQEALGQDDVDLEIIPHLDYQLTPTVALSAGWDGCAKHMSGDGFFNLLQDGTRSVVGVSWDATTRINLNPYLDFKTGNHVNLDTTTLNLLTTIKIL